MRLIIATEIEQITMNHTPGCFQAKELKKRSQPNVPGSLTFALARLISLPKRMGSTKEKPILIAARDNTSITSHRCGFRYCSNIFIRDFLFKPRNNGQLDF